MSLYKYSHSHMDMREHNMNTCFGGGKLCWHNVPNVRTDRSVVRFKPAVFVIHEAMSDVA